MRSSKLNSAKLKRYKNDKLYIYDYSTRLMTRVTVERYWGYQPTVDCGERCRRFGWSVSLHAAQ